MNKNKLISFILTLSLILLSNQAALSITYQSLNFLEGPNSTANLQIDQSDTSLNANNIDPIIDMKINLQGLYNTIFPISKIKIVLKKTLSGSSEEQFISNTNVNVSIINVNKEFQIMLENFVNPTETYFFYVYDTQNHFKAKFSQTFSALDIATPVTPETIDPILNEEELIANVQAKTFLEKFFTAEFCEESDKALVYQTSGGLYTLKIPSKAKNITELQAQVNSNAASITNNANSISNNSSSIANKANSNNAILEGSVVINESGANVDSKISGDTETNLFFIDASNNNIGIANNTPDANTKLDINGQIKITGANPGAGKVLTSDANGLASWETLAGGSGVFSTSTNITSNSGGDLSNDDFVFGSDSLDDDSNTNHDSRFFFDKSKAAFRAGLVTNSNWDEINLGLNSIAIGLNPKASGDQSIAIGNNSQASAVNSVALGKNSQASAINSIAIGEDSLASANSANSIGHSTLASANNSFAIGEFAEASNTNSISIGAGVDNSNKLSNSNANSVSIGFNSTIPTLFVNASSGVGTTGNVGIGNTNPQEKLDVSGNISVTGTVDGVNLSTLSTQVSNNTANIALKADLSGENFSGNISTDNLSAGTTSHDEALHVVGSVKIVDGNQATNKVLVSDADGVGSWQTVPSYPYTMSYAVYVDQKSSGSSGGSCAGSSAWATRTLNTTQAQSGANISRASNTITLQAGTYYVEASAPGYKPDSLAIRLRNTSDNTTAILGSAEGSAASGHATQVRSLLKGLITIASAKNFEIQQAVSNTAGGTRCLGFEHSHGNNIYTQIFIRQLL